MTREQHKHKHDFVLNVHQETKNAYLLSSTGSKKDAVWFPKSKISVKEKLLCKFAIPEWIAKQKGLFR